MRLCAFALSLAAVAATSCGGVSFHLADTPPPRAIAVLPFAGSADPTLRESARALLRSRLAARGYLTPDTAFVDRRLSEHGWLQDPAQFDAGHLPVPEVCRALGVDALLAADEVADERFNFLLLRRHRVGGELRVHGEDGATWWSCEHAAGSFGGLLLTSGQVLTELRAQFEHGTPMQALGLADEWIADAVATVPPRQRAKPVTAPPLIAKATQHADVHDGRSRIVVTARATAGAILSFDLGPVRGVPMVADPDDPTHYRGAHDPADAAAAAPVVVHAHDAFGREAGPIEVAK